MRWKYVVTVVVIVAALGGFYAFDQFRDAQIQKFVAGMAPPALPVAVAEAKLDTVPRALDGIGSLEAIRQVTIAPEVAGQITRIAFESGDQVQAGDVLVQMNDAPERADLANFQAQMGVAQLELARSRELARRQFSPQATVDRNEGQMKEAQAGMERMRALIAQKTVRAPFAGKLGLRRAEIGQYLAAGGVVTTLTDLDQLWVTFTLPEQARAEIREGQTVAVTVDAFPQRVFTGKLTAIDPQIDPATRTLKVQGTIANQDHALLPGMFAKARVELPPGPAVVTLPATAVEASLYGDSVYLVKPGQGSPDGKQSYKVARTYVKTGTRFGDRVAVLDGLRPGDQVVTSGQVRLSDGAEVTIGPDEPLTPPAVTPKA